MMERQFRFLPLNAFLCMPSSDRLTQLRNGKEYRIIFGGGVRFYEEETNKIAILKAFIEDKLKNKRLTEISQDVLLRFLQATSFDNDKCVKALNEYVKWQNEILPLTVSPNIEALLNSGVLYMSGRDAYYRPIVILNVGKVLKLKIKEKELVELLGFFFQFLTENCLIEGQIEQWTNVIDINYEGAFSIAGALINTIKFLSNMFRVRVHHSYVLRCPGTVKVLWGMIKSVVNEDQIRKLSFSGKAVLGEEAFQQINEQQVQEKYGGIQKNREKFWPIEHLSNSFSTEKHHPKLITQAQYVELHEKKVLQYRKINHFLLQSQADLVKRQKK